MVTDNYSSPSETDSAAVSTATCFDRNPELPIDPKEITLRYLHLVPITVARVKRNIPAYVSPDDLYSMGVEGLMTAVEKFDPRTAQTFPAFATMRIRGAMLDGLRRTDVCSRRMRKRARQMESATYALEQELGRAATPAEVAKHMGITQAEYLRCIEASKPKVVALDLELETSEGKGESLHNFLCDENDVLARDQMEKEEETKLLARQIAQLPELPRKILAMYYFENMRFGEIADVFDLSEARICQIHRSAITNLRRSFDRAREN